MRRCGWGLVGSGVIASGLTPWFWAVIILGALVVIVAGLLDALAKTSPEAIAQVLDDSPVDPPVEHASHWRAWERELAGTDERPVWPQEAGAPE